MLDFHNKKHLFFDLKKKTAARSTCLIHEILILAVSMQLGFQRPVSFRNKGAVQMFKNEEKKRVESNPSWEILWGPTPLPHFRILSWPEYLETMNDISAHHWDTFIIPDHKAGYFANRH